MALHPHIRFTKDYQIRAYEVDSKKRMTIPALITLMQETAMQQVIKLNISVWDLEVENLSWVMMRMQLKVFRTPILGESLKIVTNPSGFEKFFTYRDYRVYDQDDQLISSASSTWLMMDTARRRMTKIPDFILEYEVPTNFLDRPLNKLPGIKEVQREKPFEVNWHDLDFNAHLSNVYYFKWMLESMSDEVLLEQEVAQIDILFRAEAMWHEKVTAQISQLDGSSFLHKLISQKEGKELAIAKITWTRSRV